MKSLSAGLLFPAVLAALATPVHGVVSLFFPASLRVSVSGQDQTVQATALPYADTVNVAFPGDDNATSNFSGGQTGFNTDTSQAVITGGSTGALTVIPFSVSTRTSYSASGFFNSSGDTGWAKLNIELKHAGSGITIFNNVQFKYANSQNYVVGSASGPDNYLAGLQFGTLAPGNYSWETNLQASEGSVNRSSNGQISFALRELSPWSSDADGNWSTFANWGGTVPNAVGASAEFGSAILAPRVVTVDAPQTVGMVTFDNAYPYTLGGPSTLTLEATTGPAVMNVIAGSHFISAPVALNADLTVAVTPVASKLAISGTMAAAGRTLTKVGAGEALLANVRAGALNLHTGTVTIMGNGSAGSASRVDTLAIAGGATPTSSLDLTDNDLIVGNSSYIATSAQVAYARNGGAWDRGGITSTAARNHPQHTTTLGVLRGDQFIAVSGTAFDGMTVVAADTLVKYTYYGDTDFNGVVNFDDYGRTDSGFNTGGIDWLHGDFDHNGQVNFDDYALIDLAFNSQEGSLGRAISYLEGTGNGAQAMNTPALRTVVDHFALFGSAYGSSMLAAVPEPTNVGLCVIVASGLTRRRRTCSHT